MHRISLRIVLTVAGAVAAALLSAGPAAALCPDGPCVPPPGGATITHTLTVTHPSTGMVTSVPAGISCGTDCTANDSQSVACDGSVCDEPDPNNWQTFRLTASRSGTGFDPQWSGCVVQPDKTCDAKLDADRDVSVTWLDVANPTVALTAPAAGDVGSNMTVTATATDNDRVTSVAFLVDGVVKFTDMTAPYSASIAMTGYADGSSHSVAALATDGANRTTQTAGRQVTVDRHVSLTVSTPPAFTNATAVPVTIATDADATAKCSLDGAGLSTCSGSYSPITAASPDGTHTYSIVATDDVGNTASTTRSFTLDRAAPVIAGFDGPPEGSQVSTSSVTMTFDVTDANLDTVTCALDSAAAQPCSGSATLSNLAVGTHHFTVTGTDKAGNTVSKTRTFSVTAPAPPAGGTTGATGGTTPGTSTPAPAPISTTTTTTTKPRLKRNPARLVYGYALLGRTTRLPLLVVKHAAKGSKVSVRCKGRGCPKRKLVFKVRRGTAKLTSLQRRTYQAGAVLTIQVTKRGMRTKTVRITIRKGARPKVR